MKKLLLSFILSPVILLGQMRQKAIVDSIKADATDLQSISTRISNNVRAKLEQIHVSDSGEYVTLIVRVHVTDEGIIAALRLRPIPEMKISDIVTDKVNIVAVPAPPPIIEMDIIIAALQLYEVIKFDEEDISVFRPMAVTVPPPPTVIEMDFVVTALPLFEVTKFSEGEISVVAPGAVTVPPPPELVVEQELITALPLFEIARLQTEEIPAFKPGTVSVPRLREPDLYAADALELFAEIEMPVEHHPARKLDTAADIPIFEEKKMTVTGMHLSEDGYSLLEKLEGFSPGLYSLKDGGFTIGFGFFIPYTEGNMWLKGLTLEEAQVMIREKVPAYEDQVKQYINVLLTQTQFDALTMLAYNLGGFSKATSIVNDINMQADFEKLQQDWMRFVHSKAPGVTKGLMNRRKDELEVRNESNYQPERKMQILNISKK